ncbi:MAG TPA: YceI family protein [Methylomirabilota bacterium]|nr:YceI family protein [Methylomirabilota bacterium]
MRARQVGRWSAAIGGLIALVVAGGSGSLGNPAGPGSRWLGRPASAQSPEAPLRYRVVAERSEARYRVREQLVGVNFPNDAVGTTSAIDGHIALDPQGRLLPGDSRFAVDLRQLRSDEARRDNYIRRNTLETERYPTVVFVPTEFRGIGSPLPQTGPASFEVVGDLTVREATRRITWEATATFSGSDVSVRVRTAFRFGDFGLRIPRVSVVLSVEDGIRLEADLLLRRVS